MSKKYTLIIILFFIFLQNNLIVYAETIRTVEHAEIHSEADWKNPAKWQGNKVPTDTDDVIFAQADVIIDFDLTIGDLSFSSGSEKLTIKKNASGEAVTVKVNYFNGSQAADVTIEEGNELIVLENAYLGGINLEVAGSMSVTDEMKLGYCSPKIAPTGNVKVGGLFVLEGSSNITVEGDLEIAKDVIMVGSGRIEIAEDAYVLVKQHVVAVGGTEGEVPKIYVDGLLEVLNQEHDLFPENHPYYHAGSNKIADYLGKDKVKGSGTILGIDKSLIPGFGGSTTLYIQLLDFTVKNDELNRINASWTVACEYEMQCFDLEGSVDGINYVQLKSIPSIGDHDHTIMYSTTAPPFKFYRLKIIEKDASYIYSEVILFNIENDTQIEVFPNPCDEYLKIDFGTEENRLVDIYDTLGKRYLSFSTTESQIRLDEVKFLQQGIYFIIITNEINSKRYMKKIVVL